MAIKINGTTVIDDSRNLENIEAGTFTGTGALKLPTGSEAERPGSPAAGQIRFNTDSSSFEGYDGSSFSAIGGGGGTLPIYLANTSFVSIALDGQNITIFGRTANTLIALNAA